MLTLAHIFIFNIARLNSYQPRSAFLRESPTDHCFSCTGGPVEEDTGNLLGGEDTCFEEGWVEDWEGDVGSNGGDGGWGQADFCESCFEFSWECCVGVMSGYMDSEREGE